jgi:type III pantothenate kinase
MSLGILVGNTSLRYGVLGASGAVLSPGRIEWPELERRGGEIARLAAGEGAGEVLVGSVRDDLWARVRAFLPPELTVLRARDDFPLAIENRYERPEEVGTDRLLNAIAARERAGSGRGAIAVDFGTALTLSVVGPDGAFLGGLIAAGGGPLVEGLRRAAPRLPPVGDLAPGRFLESSSREALRSGLFWQLAGGVSVMLRGLLEALPFGKPLVVATGGGAAAVAPSVPEITVVAPDLTFEGLWIAREAARCLRREPR